MSSIFSKIIKGEIPAYIVAEDENHLAFLDVNPVAVGHVLVVPKKAIDYLFDIEDSEFVELMLFAKKVAAALELSVECKRISVAVIGLEVPHAHIHLIPINNLHDASFEKPRVQMSEEGFIELAAQIQSNF